MSHHNDLRAVYSQWLRTALTDTGDPDGEPWSQQRLADESGVSRATISSILNKRSDPQDDSIANLARALNVPLPRIRMILMPDLVSTKQDEEPTPPPPLLGLENRYSAFIKEIASFYVETSKRVAPEDVIDMINILYREAQQEIANAAKLSTTANLKAE